MSRSSSIVIPKSISLFPLDATCFSISSLGLKWVTVTFTIAGDCYFNCYFSVEPDFAKRIVTALRTNRQLDVTFSNKIYICLLLMVTN